MHTGWLNTYFSKRSMHNRLSLHNTSLKSPGLLRALLGLYVTLERRHASKERNIDVELAGA